MAALGNLKFRLEEYKYSKVKTSGKAVHVPNFCANMTSRIISDSVELYRIFIMKRKW